jgi:hypothetical protein
MCRCGKKTEIKISDVMIGLGYRPDIGVFWLFWLFWLSSYSGYSGYSGYSAQSISKQIHHHV